MRVLLSVLLLFWLAVTPALSADKDTKAKPDASEQSIEVVNLPLPVVQEGRLENYLFATVSVELADGSDWRALRQRAHVLRDSFLRAGHERSFNLNGDVFSLDPAALAAALTPIAQASFGAKSVKSLKIVTWSSLRARTAPGRSQSAFAGVAPN
jgi:hypothetical protein